MSAFGAAFGRALGALGGPGMAAAIVAGGVIIGGLGGGLAASRGPSEPANTTGQLAAYACPGSGAPLAMITAGQKLLVTGRTGDGAWLRIHFPAPGRTEAWVQASPLRVDGTVTGLPVAECQSELVVQGPSVAPGETLTAVANNPPTPGPTVTASASVPPTGAPNTGPTLASFTVSTGQISYDNAAFCPNAVKQATFKVRASDTAGVDRVTLYWRAPGAAGYTQTTMNRVAGNEASGTWQATLGTGANGIRRAGKLAYYVVAHDTAGVSRRLPGNGTKTIAVAVCVNTGPVISSAKSSSGSSLAWDPIGVGSCQTATNLTAVIKDAQGVRSVTLFYRRPGSTSWSSKPMDNTTVKGKWYANLDTLGDKISIPTPPTGTLRWYIKAVDDKGASSQTGTFKITIRRCDAEANFDGVFPTTDGYSCKTASIQIGTYADDRDQPNDGLRVVFYWTLTNPRTGAGPISGKMTASFSQGNYYQGTTKSFNGATYYAGELTVYAVTTDRYGGTTRTPPFVVSNMTCG